MQISDVRLDAEHLETTRIVAHGASSEHGRYYDMLRTQVLQEMDKKSWQFLAVTSPTAGCGKTVTACNLAMSIARLPERSVLLVDLDLRKPMVANYLGLGASAACSAFWKDARRYHPPSLRASIGPNNILVLPGSVSSPGSSEWMASQTMGTLLQAIKREFRSRIVIFDLPPMLLGDDVISILPRMDAALLVAGIGSTSLRISKSVRSIFNARRWSVWWSTRQRKPPVPTMVIIDFRFGGQKIEADFMSSRVLKPWETR